MDSTSTQSTQSRQHRRVLELTARQTSSIQLDINPEPSPVGLTFLSTDDLSTDGRHVGRAASSCLIVGILSSTPTAETVLGQCTINIILARGQIVAQATVELQETGQTPLALAVTGGTGAYRNVGGELTLTPLSETTGTLRLRLQD